MNIIFDLGGVILLGKAKDVLDKLNIEEDEYNELIKFFDDWDRMDTTDETVEEKSPLTIRVDKFSKQISILIGVLSVFLALLLFSKGLPFQEVLVSVIALAVSAMPEGLPLALTMALTIASNKMAKRKVVAKKLHSVESLGSCTVIASDKTGTLTVNEQTAKKILLHNGEEFDIEGTG